MNFLATEIPDVLVVEPRVFGDARGYFMETYQTRLYAEHGINAAFVQDNQSGSRQGTLRGMHYQLQQSQGKLLRVVVGAIFDVVVDLRRGSPTFGKWVGQELSAENHLQLWAPPGFAHGFLVLSEWAELAYKVTDFYAPQDEYSIRWDDPDLAIAWPLTAGESPILSARDAAALPFRDAPVFESQEEA